MVGGATRFSRYRSVAAMQVPAPVCVCVRCSNTPWSLDSPECSRLCVPCCLSSNTTLKDSAGGHRGLS